VEPDYFPPPYHGGGILVLDYEFWNQDPSQFTYCGLSWGNDLGHGYICLYDSAGIFGIWGSLVSDIEISEQNDHILFASNLEILMKSNDRGYTWTEVNNYGHRLINISPFNDSIFFSTDAYIFKSLNPNIYKSIDGGVTYSVVDTSGFYGTKFCFDSDSLHIYGASGYDFFRSSDFGNSWEIVYSDTTSLNISIDPFISGQIYLSKHNQILLSHDFGNTFQLFVELDNEIIGLYKKPLINKIYVATPLDIYEIDTTGIQLIKHLTTIENNNNISEIPIIYKLEQNFPNPFNSITTISYKVKESGKIKLLLFDVSGQELEVLLEEHQPPGEYNFQYDANDRSSGVYFYRLIVNDNPVSTKKMVIIK
jgi:hypothetical protein